MVLYFRGLFYTMKYFYKVLIGIIILAAVLCLSSCASNETQTDQNIEIYDSFEDLNGKRISVSAGSFQEQLAMNGTIIYGGFVFDSPHLHKSEDKYSGIEAEFMYDLCKEFGYGMEIKIQSTPSLLSGLYSGKIDLVGCLAYTDERAERIDYTDPYLDASQLVVVPAEHLIAADGQGAEEEKEIVFSAKEENNVVSFNEL